MKSATMKKTTIEEMIKETVRETMRKEGNIIHLPGTQPEKSEAKKKREARNAAMQKLRDQGMMAIDIAKAFGVHAETVRNNTKVSPETIGKLEEDSIDEVAVYRKGDYGFFLCAFYEDDYNRVPPDLVDVLEYAASRDAEWIMLEPDAETVNGLPVYTW